MNRVFYLPFKYKKQVHTVGVAKFDTIREPDTTNPFINRLWVEVKRVRVIFGSTRLTRLVNGSCSCSTCEPV